jgi:hypothetical protein
VWSARKFLQKRSSATLLYWFFQGGSRSLNLRHNNPVNRTLAVIEGGGHA